MKVKDKFDECKAEKPSTLVLIKVGSFYVSYGMDAFVFSYLFSYQIKNDKVGFPLTALDKVLVELEDKKLSYLVINGEDMLEREFPESPYFSMLTKAQKFHNDKTLTEFLLDRIRFLIRKDEGNYFKIKEFIDEL